MQRFNATQVNSELFYKFPKFLLQNKNYSSLSNDSKLLYMILRDRYQCSLVNGWVDENQNVYVFYSTDDLKDVLNIGINKVTKLKKELVDAGLLEIVKQGFNKTTKKNYPDRLYLLQPEYGSNDLTSQSSHAKTLATSDFTKTVISKEAYKNNKEESKKLRENSNKQASALEPRDFTETVTYKDRIDTNIDTIKDTKPWNFSTENYDSETVAKQNKDILEHLDEVLIEDNIPMFLNKDSIHLLSSWFTTPSQVSEAISTILNAANDSRAVALQQTGKHALDFDHDEELNRRVGLQLRRYFNRMRNSKKGEIKDPKAYLYTTMLTLFDSWQNGIMMEEKKD